MQVDESVAEKQVMLLQQVEDFIKQPVRQITKPNMKRRPAIDYDVASGKLLLPLQSAPNI